MVELHAELSGTLLDSDAKESAVLVCGLTGDRLHYTYGFISLCTLFLVKMAQPSQASLREKN